MDIFEGRYCSKCFSPVFGERTTDCPICGEPLTAITFEERIERDEEFKKPVRVAFMISQILMVIAYAINLAYCIVGIVKIVSGEAEAVPSPLYEENGFSLMYIWDYGLGVTVAFTVLSLIIFILGAFNITPKDHRGLLIFLSVASDIGAFMFMTRNFVGGTLLVASLLLFYVPQAVINGKKYQERRLTRIYKNRYDSVDSKVWRCKHCGYINEKRDSECKSCGKYR